MQLLNKERSEKPIDVILFIPESSFGIVRFVFIFCILFQYTKHVLLVLARVWVQLFILDFFTEALQWFFLLEVSISWPFLFFVFFYFSSFDILILIISQAIINEQVCNQCFVLLIVIFINSSEIFRNSIRTNILGGRMARLDSRITYMKMRHGNKTVW